MPIFCGKFRYNLELLERWECLMQWSFSKRGGVKLWVSMLGCMIALVGCQKEQKIQSASAPKPVVPVTVVKAHETSLWLKFLAKSEAASHVDVTARVEGELEAVVFRPGQRVKAGDLLFRIDKTPYLEKLYQAQAELDNVEASYHLAKSKVARYRPLMAEHLIAKEKFDQLKAMLKKYIAQLKAAKAAIAQARLRLSWCDMKATIDGIVDRSRLLKGSLVKPGTTLTSITDADRLYLYFHPTSHDAALIRKYRSGEHPAVEASVRGSQGLLKPLKGYVEYMAPAADATTDTVTMRAVVKNPDRVVAPGSFFDLKMLLGTWRLKTVSARQLNYAPGGRFLYVVGDDGIVKKVMLHPIFENDEIAVLGDEVPEGTMVAAGMFGRLSEGMRVRPKIVTTVP